MTKQEKISIFIQALFMFSNAMYSMFVSVYLYIYTDSLVKMTIYTLIRMTAIPISLYFGGVIARKHSLTATFGLGLSIQTLSLIYILVASPLFIENSSYVYLAAIPMGIGEGLYYYSQNVMNQIVTTVSRRARYLSVLGFFNNCASLLAPFLANRLIAYSDSDLSAYRKILVILVVIFFIITVVSLSIRAKDESKQINVRKSLDLKNPEWYDQMKATLIHSIRETLNWSIIPILLSTFSGNGTIYSAAQTIFSVLTVLCFLVLAKNLKKDKIGRTFAIGTALNCLGAIILVLLENLVGVIIYGICNCLSSVFYENSYSYLQANVLEKYKSDLSGRIIAKEIPIYIGRSCASLLIVLCYFILPSNIYYKVPIILYSLTPILVYRIMMKYNVN